MRLILNNRWSWVLLFLAIFIVIILLSLFDKYKKDSDKFARIRNMRSIRSALVNYQYKHKNYPAIINKLSSSNSLTSWRVLLAEILENQQISYDTSKPWDFESNKSAMTQTPYHLAIEETARKNGITNYVAIETKNRRITGKEYQGSENFPFCVVELMDSNIFWSEPKDITSNELQVYWQHVIDTKQEKPMILLNDGNIEELSQDIVDKIAE